LDSGLDDGSLAHFLVPGLAWLGRRWIDVQEHPPLDCDVLECCFCGEPPQVHSPWTKKTDPIPEKIRNIDQIDGIENEFSLIATYFFQRAWQCPPAPQQWYLKLKTRRGALFAARPGSYPGRRQGLINEDGQRLAIRP